MTVEAGGYRITLLNPAAITAILELTDAAMIYGVMRFADFSGYIEHLLTYQRAAFMKGYARLPRLLGAPAHPPNSSVNRTVIVCD